MKTKHIIACLALGPLPAFAEYDMEVRLNDCPAPVRETIQANARNGVIDEIEVITIENKRIYIAKVDLPRDIDLEVFVNGDGALVKTREDIKNGEIPAFVRAAAREFGGGVSDVEKETTGKTITYHVDIDRQGAPDLDVVFDASGKVLSKTEEIED